MKSPVLVWLREDLRLSDHPALAAAAQLSRCVVCLYVAEGPLTPADQQPGGAAKWWLHKSLQCLKRQLALMGVPLILRRGEATHIVPDIARQLEATTIYWTRRYAPFQIATDKRIKADLRAAGRTVDTFNGRLLFEPWELKTKTGNAYRVFTPMWRAMQAIGHIRAAIPVFDIKQPTPETLPESESIDDWAWHPSKPDWSTGFNGWTPGEKSALHRLSTFLDTAAATYATDRNRPDRLGTSGLSPHLQTGEISPVTIWHAVKERMSAGEIPTQQGMVFLSEIAWREFSYTQLYHAPHMLHHELNPKFSRFPWHTQKPEELRAWQQGYTGYPIIDAGMRQLYQTGWMHNRVRMIVGSFLVKHLLIDWRQGMSWFWDTLLDADIASNTASWQWIAGCGADAAPYFRVFNPMLQGKKFDPEGKYVRRYLPELATLPDNYIQTPWLASKDTLLQSGVILGVSYPYPIVGHEAARQAALDAYTTIKNK